ncbi:MAG: CopG family transcriptional regulator [Dehalococcoidia bacterium]
MKRKQIYLDDDQERAIKRLARDRGVSEAAIIREAMGAYLAEEPATYDAPALAELHVIGCIDEPNLPRNGSTTFKRDLYGQPGGPL